MKYHLLYEYELPKNSFFVGEKIHDVPCVFQIWEKKDFEQMIDLGEKMWKESTYKTISFSRERLQKLGDHLIERPEKGMGFVAIDEDKIIGMIIVHLTKYFFIVFLAIRTFLIPS